MLNKKICMLGAYAVGKSALVQRYVHSIFEDRYLSTVGVKISKKVLTVNNEEMVLVLWDLEGKDDYVDVKVNYLRGSMGFFVVADGMRKETLDIALSLRTLALELIGPVPHALLVNKADLLPSWEVTDSQLQELEKEGIPLFRTSAKMGLAVEEAFTSLAEAMLDQT
jgi:small GTP-binding protein